MVLVPWIQPSAILLTPENYSDIQFHTTMTEEALKDNYYDTRADGQKRYVVAHRLREDGVDTVYVVTETALKDEFLLMDIRTRFLTSFETI